MSGLNTIEILYIIFLFGSLAFGFEAMLVGLGGKLMVMYRRRKSATLGATLLSGLAVVAVAILTSMALKLEPILFVVLVLVYVFLAGKLIKLSPAGRVPTPLPPIPPQSSETEIEEIVRKRGYDKLVVKRKSGKARRRR